MSDPFGRAIADFHRGEQDEPLLRRDGDDEEVHPVERFYFTPFDGGDGWLVDHLDGPLVTLGCGTGRHALYFQERFETVALDRSEHLVETAMDRGVEDARVGDMLELRAQFERDRFRSALAIGTQVCLAPSVDDLSAFLGDLAHVTTADATAVVDGYDPDHPDAPELLGFREAATPGLGYRVFHFEYEGEFSEGLLFRLFSPDRLREAATGTGWRVAEVRRHESQYRARLEKR